MTIRPATGLLAAAALALPASAAEGAPRWYETVDLSGSVRMRYEGISNSNPAPPDPEDQNRYRYQALLALRASPDSNVEIGVTLGSSGDAVSGPSNTSQNVTLDDAFRDDPLYIDRAYVAWRPDGRLARDSLGLSLVGGKFENPNRTLRFLWDSDISPEGYAAVVAPPVLSAWKASYVHSFWVLEEENQGALASFSAGDDAYVLAHQLRLGRDGVPALGAALDLSAWASIYHMVRPSLITRPAANLGFGNNSNDGVRFLGEFEIVDVGLRAGFPLLGRPAWAAVQWAQNDGAVPNPATGAVEDAHWAVEAGIGRVARRGDWLLLAQWTRMEADAQVSAFVDAELGSGLGQTNFEGVRIEGRYGLADHLALGLAWYHVQEENGVGADPDQEIVQVDFTARF